MSIHKAILTKYLKSKKIHVEPDWELVHIRRLCFTNNIDPDKTIQDHNKNRRN